MSHFFTKNKISNKELFFLSWPIFIEMFLRVFIGNINVWMISQHSEPAVAAVGAANQLLNLSVFIYGFITVGVQIIIAQLIGAKKEEQIKEVITTGLIGSFLIGLILSSIFVLFPEQLLYFMNLPDNIVEIGIPYIRIFGASLFVTSISAAIIASLRSHGKTKAALIIPTISLIFALIGNYIALYGPFGLPHLGVAGLGISAVVSNTVALFIAFIILKREVGFNILNLSFKDFSKEKLKLILTLGLPSSGENLSYTASQVVVTMIVASLGQNMLIAKSYVTAITQFIYLIAASLSQGNQIMIGRNIGAKEYDRAYLRGKNTVILGLLCTSSISIVTWLCIEPIMHIFTYNPEVIAIAKIVFLVDIFLEAGRTINMTMVGSLNATGDVKFPLICSLIVLWIISLPFSYVLAIPLNLGLVGVWLAYTIDEGLRAILMIKRWKSGVWKSKGHIT
ncbi:MATE family efflux transporter [Vagococcus carniphilus]|uniref:MATE family efflux transporter n=1 Tax=Vagococcus carniphilus TaxID=218144 RepID=UPI00288C8F2A|nr:MATE family efflux transporter [Vagococcus carniphilus]MDT2814812.1 MATE family efflux transporter [Vagococcus carniphilus]